MASTTALPRAHGARTSKSRDKKPAGFHQSWYAIARSDEVRAGEVIGRDFLDGRAIAYRGENGQAVVMNAYCRHLGADLSMGKVFGNDIRCAFHHWQYGPDGACTKIPASEKIPKAAKMFKYPTVEKWGLIWAFNGATPLFDALILAADFISNHRRASGRNDVRPVLLLFSDGCDTLSMHSANEALQAALNAGALIYSVDMAQNPTAGTTFLRQVSMATGGRYFPLTRPNAPENDATAVLSAVLDDLRASYVVTYDLPSHQAGFHSLRLLPTRNLKLTFHSRGGYIYDPAISSWETVIKKP